jgi:ATP synthase I chain.
MGEESPALPTEAPLTSNISHRRLLIEMAVLIALGSVAGFIFGGLRFGFGVLFGGALAFLNYYWLKRSTAAIFEKAVSGANAVFVSFRFILRYIAVGVVILAVHFSGAMPAVAVIAGLSAFAIAVVVDGLISIFRRNI